MKKTTCPLCNQKMDIFTTVHRKVPFVDNKTYPVICFTCYFAPKVGEQKYNKDGSVSEDIELPYSCENIHTPKELVDSGAADSMRQAKASVEAVTTACHGVRPPKKPVKRPPASWNVT